MLRRSLLGSQLSLRTTEKTLFAALVIATVTAFIVWTRTVDLLTVVKEAKHNVNTNSTSQEDFKSILAQMYESRFKDLNTSSTKDANFTAVILLTYMRSGSSLTGEILQQNDNAFYVFEPLRALNNLVKTGRPVQWMNGTISAASNLNMTDVKRQTLIGWLTCNFSIVYAQSFEDWYFFSFGKKTMAYSDCVSRKFGIRLKDLTSNRTTMYIRQSAFRRGLGESCLKDLKKACLSSKFRIIKTIRTSMDLAGGILTKLNAGKVIHLIRDPRETVISQARYSGCPGDKKSVLSCANSHCKSLWDDLKVKQNILTEKPGRVFTVLYEHISSYPSYMTKVMYKFIGMEFSDKINNYVSRIAQGRNVTGCKVCEQSWEARNYSYIFTDRLNILSKVNPYVITYIQDKCENVIKQFDYKMYNSSQSRTKQ